MAKISIALVDDHPLLIEGVITVLKNRLDCEVSLSGARAGDMMGICGIRCPDVMIVDLSMPGDALQAIEQTKSRYPRVKLIVFTASINTEHAIRALEAGASGYVLKGSTADELIEAIEAVLGGAVYVTPFFMARILSTLQTRALQKKELTRTSLSARETQVMKLLLDGKQNKEIATALSLSEKTVKGYMTHLMQKLHARNRLEVVIAAQRMNGGTIDPQRATP